VQCRGVEDEACRQVQLPCRGAGSLPRQDRTYPAPARARPPPRARSSAALRGESLCSLPPCMGLAAVSRGRRPRRPWHTWRSELLSETLACACMHGCAATRLGAEQWISRWSIHTSERDLQVV